jgi:hypothetical protein
MNGRSPRPRCWTARRMSERSKREPVATGSGGLFLSVCLSVCFLPCADRQTNPPSLTPVPDEPDRVRLERPTNVKAVP